MNPRCTNMCTYPQHTEGRRPLFCSPNCAKRHSDSRKKLLSDLTRIDEAITGLPPRARASKALRQRRAHITWHLARYGVDSPYPAA